MRITGRRRESQWSRGQLCNFETLLIIFSTWSAGLKIRAWTRVGSLRFSAAYHITLHSHFASAPSFACVLCFGLVILNLSSKQGFQGNMILRLPCCPSRHVQSCAEKRDCFAKHQPAWPAVAGCSRAETFSQLSSISVAQPCMWKL